MLQNQSRQQNRQNGRTKQIEEEIYEKCIEKECDDGIIIDAENIEKLELKKHQLALKNVK